MSDSKHTSNTTSPSSLRQLRAGPITALFDVNNGFLRQIRLGNVELLRGIYGAVRNRDWDTVTPDIEDLEIEQTNLRFEVRFNAGCLRDEIDYHWRGTISCEACGRLEYTFDGVARSDFQRNRIGLCVLHPIKECAGKPCIVEHTDGSIEHGAFPAFISPHQPFFNLRALMHDAGPGIRVETRFEGDVFEMEDQRNWTDASFKTYSTPLALPFPVAVASGTRIHQSVIVNVTADITANTVESDPSPSASVVEIDMSECQVHGRPSIGVEWIPHERPSSLWFNALRELAPDHLRVELRLTGSDWKNRLEWLRHVAEELPAIKWHPVVFLDTDYETGLEALANELTRMPGLNISLLLILPTTGKVTSRSMIDSARRHLEPLFSSAEFAAGTDAYCAELNRARPEQDRPARPCFSINPQVHAFDDLSLMETLEAQTHAVETIANITGQSVVISPVTLLPRFNPNATSTSPLPPEPGTDPRQSTPFCAAWTLGTLARLAVHRSLHSVTLFELEGPRGFFRLHTKATPKATPEVEADATATTSIERFPCFHVLHDLASFSKCGAPSVSQPDNVAALHCSGENGRERLLLANLTPHEQIIRIRHAVMPPVLMHIVSTSNDTSLINGNTLTLGPYNYIALDLTHENHEI